jgi:hypothetical protein
MALLLFDFAATGVTGVIVGKKESIETGLYSLTPPIYHHFAVTIAPSNRAAAFPYADQFLLSARAFDQLHVGETVTLRQFSFGPLRLARPAGGSLLLAIPVEEFDRLFFAVAWPLSFIVLVALVLAPQFARRGKVMIAIMAAVAVLLDGFLLRAWWIPRPSSGKARICAVETVRANDMLTWFLSGQAAYAAHVTLPRAYDEVQLRLRPAPGAEIVTAVDRVDAGTAGRLRKGDDVDVVYNSGDPRDARLNAGTRSYAWRNELTVYGAELGVLVLLLLAGTAFQTFGRRVGALAEKRRSERR